MKEIIENYLVAKGYKIELNSKGILTVHNYQEKEYKIMGELGNNFPFCLPNLILLDRNKFKRLAHVTWDKKKNEGLICTGVSESRSINFASPELVYEQCLLNGIETLEKALSSSEVNETEIMEEFNAHWRDIVKKSVLSFVEPTDKIKSVKVAKTIEEDFYLIDYKYEINNEYTFLKKLENKHQIIGKGIYINFKKKILPPTPEESLMNWWKKLLNNFPDKRKELRDFTKGKKSKMYFVIGSIKISYRLIWFALMFQNDKKNSLPVRKKDDFNSWKIEAYDIQLHNKDYIFPRGGANRGEIKKKILIVGCGSVGGEIADNIASSGLVDEINLIDYDKMNIENIYRHNLGGKYIDVHKIRALKRELEMKYPYLNVKCNYDINKNYLQNYVNKLDLNAFDGVIVATGDATIERYFNESMMKKNKRPWVIYTWLEGFGIGGHAIYVHNEGKGCLTCLYRNENGENSLNCIQNFLMGGQDVAIDISGCGSNFLPYSNLDAKETALLSSRLALKALTNQLDESKRISWKGFLDKDTNLKTTRRYRDKEEKCLKLLSLSWKGCGICGN